MSPDRAPVFFFLPDFTAGGAERATVRTVNGLSAIGIDVRLIVSRATGPLSTQIGAGVPVIDLNGPSLLKSVPALHHILKAHHGAILFPVMMQASFAALALKRLALPRLVVAPIEHSFFGSWRAALGPVKFKLYAGLYNRLYRHASRVVCVGLEMAQEMRRFLPREARNQLRVIYNPVVDPMLDELSIHGSKRSPRAGSNDIVFAGRLSPEKDPAFLLEAFGRMQHRNGTKLRFLGDGPERAALEARTNALGLSEHVVFEGFQANPYPAIARARAVALSSRVEGFPTVLVEALYLGTRVVSNDCKTGPREIIDDARLGRLVPQGDLVAYAAALDALVTEPGADAAYLRSRADAYGLKASIDGYAMLIAELRAAL